ncbi:MAG: hypothetical protein ACRBBP_06620 [Bdellovibrionales bacterium]
MKKYLSVLIGLSITPLSNLAAEELLYFTAAAVEESAPAAEVATPAISPGNDLASLVLGALGEDVPEVSSDPVITTTTLPLHTPVNADPINAVVRQVVLSSDAQDADLMYLKHNDLRAAVKNGSPLIQSLSKDILMNIKDNPALFTGIEGLTYYMDKDEFGNPHDKTNPATGRTGLTALGPEGDNRTKDGKQYYHINEERNEKRRNVIFSASFERISKKSDNSFDIDLLLFLHSDSTGHIFRYINVSIDPNSAHPNLVKLVENGQRVRVANLVFNDALHEIPLSDTNFTIHVELATQKALLTDLNHGITKVIPITAGSIDSRTASGDPSKVNSMTLLVPGREIRYRNFELEDSVLVKRKTWFANNNNNQRVSPAYYKGRPFIGLIDRSRMAKNEDGSFKKYLTRVDENGNNTFVLGSDQKPILDEVNGTPYYPAGYRLIGFHYQIEATGLKRGFESHGCIRLQDHDLYTIDAIVNAGPKDLVPVEVKMLLNEFQDLDSIYKRSSNYKKVIYSTSHEPDNFTVYCKNKGSYPVRSFTGQDGRKYHTLSDSDCLTSVAPVNSSVEELSDVLTGQSNSVISTLEWDGGHSHIDSRKKIIEENASYLNYLRADVLQATYFGDTFSYLQGLQNYGSSQSTYRSIQIDQIALVDEINSCKSNPECNSIASSYIPQQTIAQVQPQNVDSWGRIILLPEFVNEPLVKQEAHKYEGKCNEDAIRRIPGRRNKKNRTEYCHALKNWFVGNKYGRWSL